MCENTEVGEVNTSEQISDAIQEIRCLLDSIEKRNYRTQMNTDLPQEVLSFLRANENDAEEALKALKNFENILQKSVDNEVTRLQKTNKDLEEQLRASIPKHTLAEMFRV